MEYATGDVQKGPVLLASPLKGMISNSKLHHTIMLWMYIVDTQVKMIQSHMKKRAREEISLSQFNPLFIFIIASVIKC